MSQKLVEGPRGRWIWAAVAFVVVVVMACGRVPTSQSPSDQVASGVRSPSPVTSASTTPTPSAISIPDSSVLTARKCSASPPTTSPVSLTYFSIRPAANWTKSGDYQHTETLLLELTAPQAYSSGRVFVQFHSDLGPVHTVYGTGATANSIAHAHAASAQQEIGAKVMAGNVSDCSVAAEPSSVFGFSDGDFSGYRMYVVHQDSLYEFDLYWNGGGVVSNQAISDYLAMLGSVTWAS